MPSSPTRRAGPAPRDPRGPGPVHGGQAHRLTMLKPESYGRWPTGGCGGVAGFYLGALSFVEHLMAPAGAGRHERPPARPWARRATSTRPSSESTARTSGHRRLARASAAPATRLPVRQLADPQLERQAGDGARASDREAATASGGARRRPAAGTAGRSRRPSRRPLPGAPGSSRRALALGQDHERDLLVLARCAPAPWPRPRATSSPPRRSTRPVRQRLGCPSRRGPGPRRPSRPGSSCGPPPPCPRSRRRRRPSGADLGPLLVASRAGTR